MRSSRYNSGFILVAVLVGLMVISLVFVNVLKLTRDSQTVQGLNERRSEFDSARSSIQRIFESNSMCGVAFRSAGAPVVVPSILPDETDDSTAVNVTSLEHAGSIFYSFPSTLSPRTRLSSLKIIDMNSDGIFTKGGRTYKKYVSHVRLMGESGAENSSRLQKHDFFVPLVSDAATNEIAGCRQSIQAPLIEQGTETCAMGADCQVTINFFPTFGGPPRIIPSISKYRYRGVCRADDFQMRVKVIQLSDRRATLLVKQGGDPDVGCGGYFAEEISWMAIGSEEGTRAPIFPLSGSPVPSSTPSIFNQDIFDINLLGGP